MFVCLFWLPADVITLFLLWLWNVDIWIILWFAYCVLICGYVGFEIYFSLIGCYALCEPMGLFGIFNVLFGFSVCVNYLIYVMVGLFIVVWWIWLLINLVAS